jgi:16S rRNA (uracil1498-N3)-methyltransferase
MNGNNVNHPFILLPPLPPMSDRYFVESPVVSDRATLAGAEAHHLLHVMRAKAGTRATLFDGSGWEFDAIVGRIGRSEVELIIAGRQEINREAQIAVTLAVALPKGDRQKWLIEKVVELGVARLVPIETERGVAQPVENALERLRRGVIEASKQCGRNRLMEIAEPKAWRAFLVETAGAACRLVAHPANRPSGGTRRTRPTLLPASSDSATLAVGPEGGFTDREIAIAMDQGWQPVDLGPRILRVETAAVAIAVRLITT